MKKNPILILILLFSSGIANSQTNFYQRLADSVLVLTKQKVAYDQNGLS